MNKYEGLKNRISAGIVGARGYSGLELARILLGHPAVDLVACFFNDKAFRLEDALPEADGLGIPVLPLNTLSAAKLDVVFLATPAEASLELAPQLLGQGKQVIDLSGAFRLDESQYDSWYGFKHSEPEILQNAQYGLVPWSKPIQGKLVANPGCYATSVLMAILPLLKAGIVDPATLVIDAKSGTTGAGKKATEALLFSEVDGDCRPYRVAKHQHLPEIQKYAVEFAQAKIEPFFSTHLLPTKRGIVSSIYARLKGGATEANVAQAFTHAYGSYPLVSHGVCSEPLLSLNRVTGSPRTQIAYHCEPGAAGSDGKLYLFSMIDNLLKGAASQAVENLNCLWDLPVETGLVVKKERNSA